MKSLWKLSAIAVAAMGGSLAQADVTLTNTASGSELVLFVRDISAGAAPDRVYARGLGILLDSVLTQAGAGGAYTGPGSSISYSLPAIGADSNLSAFLGAGSSFVWTVMAADTVGNGAFQQRYLTTTQVDAGATGFATPANGDLRSAWSGIAGMFTDLNGALPDTGANSTTSNGLWGQTGGLYTNAIDWFASGFGNQNALGQAANFYVLATAGTASSGASRLFSAGQLVLSALGELSVVGNAPAVPLPPALLLLGSAFAGLAGIARRRNEKSAPVAA